MGKVLRVRLFASFREALNKEEIRLNLESNATVNDLRKKILDLYPEIASMNIPVMIALNRKIANDNAIVSDGDEVALLPPVSGG